MRTPIISCLLEARAEGFKPLLGDLRLPVILD